MPIIYQPSGKAREYCSLAANLYSGCSHGCKYCYSPAILRKTEQEFLSAAPRKSIISQISSEAPRYAGKEIHLCFTCDPYQHIENEHNITSETLRIFTRYNITARILTKGGERSLKDISLMQQNRSIYGATLTFVDNSDSTHWEPDAALPQSRFAALREAKRAGLRTWASLEPVIDPKQTLEIIEITHDYIDEYKIGKWNHDSRSNEINWKRFVDDVTKACEKYGKKYMLKKDLIQYAYVRQ